MAGMTADGNSGLGLEAHIGGGGVAASGGANASPHVAWIMIIGALLLLVLAGTALRKVRI